MDVSLVLLSLLWLPTKLCLQMKPSTNITNSTNDMYVIHATVYQVGIITNKSDDEIANMTGNQEALSFYHSNGSAMDLSSIPAPLMTNVTAQSAVAVARVLPPSPTPDNSAPLAVPEHFPSEKKSAMIKRSENLLHSLDDEDFGEKENSHTAHNAYVSLFRRSTGNSSGVPAIQVVKETSLIPLEAGLKSIGLPNLVGLNTSVASLPLPIPNTSVLRYAKINTVVKSP